MGLVALEGEVFVLELEQLATRGVEAHAREGARAAGELLARLLEVVEVEVCVAEGEDEFAGPEAGHLGHHQGEERVGGDVERHAEEEIGAALVKLAGDAALGDVELEEGMAGRQRHLVDVRRVPGADDVAAGVGAAAQVLDQALDLVDLAAVGRAPVAPLVAVDRAEVAAFVGPFVPDGDAVVLEPLYVGVAAQEPEEFVDDALQVQLLGGEQREALGEPEAQLPAEDRDGAGAGSVGLARAVGEDVVQQVQVLPFAHNVIVAQSSAALWNLSSGSFASMRPSSGWCMASDSGSLGTGAETCMRIRSAGPALS